MPFYPENAPVPTALHTPEFSLRPLLGTDVDLDYDAVMESQAELRQGSDDGWPSADFTRAQNLADLVRHEREHRERVAFTYTVISHDQSQCLGCVYIRPLDPLVDLLRTNSNDADILDGCDAIASFWVRTSRLADGLDRRVLTALLAWFERDWAFQGVVFAAHSKVVHQVENFAAGGLRRLGATAATNGVGKELIYG